MEVTMFSSRVLLAAATLSALTLAGCATDAPETPGQEQALQQSTESSLAKMYQSDPGLHDFVSNAYAYAIFPSVGKGGLIAGGASGRGEVFKQGQFIGYSELNQVTVGAQVGGQEYAELVVFENEPALWNFQHKEYSFSANASAIALTAGASKEAHFRDGVAVFTLPTGGLMAEASVGGQSFTFQPASSDMRSDHDMRSDNDHRTQSYQSTETKTETHMDNR